MNSLCEHLDAYIGGELSGTVAQGFEAHLAVCSACAAELGRHREMERLLNLAKDRLEPVPASLQFRVERGMAGTVERSQIMERVLRFAPLAAAAVLLLALMLIWSQRADRSSRALIHRPDPLSPDQAVVSIGPERALAQLAALATERRSPKSGATLACLSIPAFPAVEAEMGLRPLKSRRTRPGIDEDAERARDADGPKTGRLPRFNATSIQSIPTIGERRFVRVPVEVPSSKKEDIPC